MRRSMILVAAFLMNLVGMAQTFGEIHGQVFDESGAPYPMANVQLLSADLSKGIVTELDGKFKLKPLVPGIYTLKISAMSYAPIEVTDILVSPDKITFLSDLTLRPDPEKLGVAEKIEYVVPLIDPDNTGMQTITAEEIKNQPEVKNIATFVAKTTPGVTTNAEGTELYFRGSRAGTALYFVDGVKIIGRAPKIPQSGIGSINVYTGGVPAKYGDVTGGVIVIETKNYFDLYNKKVQRQRATEKS
ncbi:MAG: TonB-dependent receptor plug domain-containing protein [Flavobacteriales bacterium]|nr:TonB-dependent receptor plug domain-containing protein [Flavobacteriales bacterium]